MNIKKMNGDLRFIKAVEFAEIKPNDKILDLGSGDNILLKYIYRYIHKQVNYTSVDYNNKGLHKINYDLEKGFPPQLKNKKFDKIFLLEFIEHIENFKSLLIHCKNILEPNGKIIITTPTNFRYMKNESYKSGADAYGNLADHYHCFRKANLINLANYLGMNYKITGVHIRIPKLNIFIPSSQTFYNDTFLMVLSSKV